MERKKADTIQKEHSALQNLSLETLEWSLEGCSFFKFKHTIWPVIIFLLAFGFFYIIMRNLSYKKGKRRQKKKKKISESN